MIGAMSFFRAHIIRRLLAAQILFSLGVSSRALVHAVPMAPNESWVIAEIVELSVVESSSLNIQPPQNLFLCQLRITKVGAVAGAENILRGNEGKTIEALTRAALGSGNLKGQWIRARISFQGDERGGHYWILESKVMARAQ